MKDPADLLARNRAMRKARDEILRRIGIWLTDSGFSRAGAGHFVRVHNQWTFHIGFQKLSSGRSVRVTCHISSPSLAVSINGSWSDKYEGRDSPNGMRYGLSWSTRESDISHCVDEFCRYVREVVFQWFMKQSDGLKELGASRSE
jgi:hypothetical protein